ncbi:hypothetical protein BH20GEM2_BH20GEM2_14800 [soil metagenome]
MQGDGTPMQMQQQPARRERMRRPQGPKLTDSPP